MTITWNPARKPLRVQFPNGNILEFEYDGMGHRALKRFTRAADTLVVTTRYERDAQGNTLAIYTAQDTTARLIGTAQVDHEDERIRSIRYLRDNLTPTQFADLLAEWLSLPTIEPVFGNPNLVIPCCTTAACTTLETNQQKAQYILQTYSTNSQYDECLEALISACEGNVWFYNLMVERGYGLDPAGRRKESRLGVKLAEQHLYGSSRLGIDLRNEPVYCKTFTRLWNPWLEAWNTPTTVYWTPPAADANRHSFVRGRKRYELANHLGNVSAVISDKKLMTDNLDSDGIADEFHADVRTAQDYYAFGSPRYDRKAKLPTTTEVIVCRIRVHRFEMNDCIQIVIPPVLTEDVTNSYCYDNAIPLEQALQELVSQFTFNSSYVATVEGTDIIIKTTVANLENLRYCDFPVRVAVTQGTAKAEVIDAYQCPEAYRYAFNGKENDREIYGEDNAYDFGARMYDARIGRWFSVDPQKGKYPFFSPYVAFGNNPVYYIDPGGETLDVAQKDEQAKADVQSVGGLKYSKHISIDDAGRVSLNFDNMNDRIKSDPKKMQRYINQAMMHAGVRAIADMIEAKEKYFYSTSAPESAIDNASGDIVNLDGFLNFEKGTTKQGYFFNFSTTDYEPKVSNGDAGLRPSNGYDGAVYIAKGDKFSGVQEPELDFRGNSTGKTHLNIFQVQRASTVYHELRENFLRTSAGMYYDSAHRRAIADEGSTFGNLTPGETLYFNYQK
jgi:RHS repeat-associated protein